MLKILDRNLCRPRNQKMFKNQSKERHCRVNLEDEEIQRLRIQKKKKMKRILIDNKKIVNEKLIG